MKRYTNEGWLRQKYLRERRSVSDIAKMCNVTNQTIFNYLHKFGIK